MLWVWGLGDVDHQEQQHDDGEQENDKDTNEAEGNNYENDDNPEMLMLV